MKMMGNAGGLELVGNELMDSLTEGAMIKGPAPTWGLILIIQ